MAGSKEISSSGLAALSTPLTPERRKELIAEAAYCLAEQRGFRGGCQLHDWLEAETKIDHIYGKAE